MNKKKTFEAFLNDPILIEKGYIEESDLERLDWSNDDRKTILQLLKLIITHVDSGSSISKTNRILNQAIDNSI